MIETDFVCILILHKFYKLLNNFWIALKMLSFRNPLLLFEFPCQLLPPTDSFKTQEPISLYGNTNNKTGTSDSIMVKALGSSEVLNCI